STAVQFGAPTGHDNSKESFFQMVYDPNPGALNDRTGAGFALATGDVVILTGTAALDIGGVGFVSTSAGIIQLHQAAGSSPGQPLPQLQAVVPLSGSAISGVPSLTDAALQPVLAQAIAAWRAAGATPQQLSALDGVSVNVGSLPSDLLGVYVPGQILINRDA